MGAACDYLMGLGMENVEKYEHELSKYLYEVRLAGFCLCGGGLYGMYACVCT